MNGATHDAAARALPVFRPDVDVFETADEFLVTADLPGVDPSGVQIGLREGVLSLDATVAATLPDADWRRTHVEARTGRFHRAFTLSDEIDEAGIRAELRDGVLTLRLPKSPRHRVRRIEVTA